MKHPFPFDTYEEPMCEQPTSRYNVWGYVLYVLFVAFIALCIWGLARNSFGQQQPPPIYQWQGNVPAYRQVYPEQAWFYPPAPRRGPALGPWKFPIARSVLGIPPYRQQRGMVIIPGQPPQQPYPQQPPQQDPGGSAYYP